MFDTNHHSAFDKWWEYAAKNYVAWDDDKPVSLDLYYDPVVDEHVGRGPMGIIAPAWYFAPQRNQVAKAGWQTAAMATGVFGDGPIVGLDQPGMATMVLQLAGEFAEPGIKQKLWDAAEEHIEPTLDPKSGEFTLGLGLNEKHPRGQWNARMMAGWVCTEGAWSRIFNEPNLDKFHQPTVEGVDFPSVALSEAKWDGNSLHIAAQAQNASIEGSRTTVRLVNLDLTKDWTITDASGKTLGLQAKADYVEADLTVDNQVAIIRHN